MRRRLCALLGLLSLALLPSSLFGVTVDWDTLSWTAGNLSNNLEVDGSSAGTDVNVAVSGSTGQLTTSLDTGTPMTPAITRAFDGGLSPGQKTLELALNLTSRAQSVTVTMTFSNNYPAVGYVSFQLFDIDFANSGGNTYQDVISSITGATTGGSTIAPTISGVGANVTLSGSGTSQLLTGQVSTVDTGAGSGAGNATIFFNSSDIRSITFTYSSSNLFANPTYQHIGIFDIMYVATPEINPGWLAIAGCAALALWPMRRRISRRNVG